MPCAIGQFFGWKKRIPPSSVLRWLRIFSAVPSTPKGGTRPATKKESHTDKASYDADWQIHKRHDRLGRGVGLEQQDRTDKGQSG